VSLRRIGKSEQMPPNHKFKSSDQNPQIMKPTDQFLHRHTHSLLLSIIRRLPLTDYYYQSHFIEESGGATEDDAISKPSFREISRGYLKREAIETFVAEAALFSVITVVTVVSLLICAEALVQLMQSVSAV
jgi:hypothetical protein